MNRRTLIFLAAFLISLISNLALAQDSDETKDDESKSVDSEKNYGIEVPPGMELKRFGGLNMVIPQGTQVYQKNSLQVMEGPDEYVARNFVEMKERLQGIEAQQSDLKKEVIYLKEAVSKLQKKLE